MVGTKILDERKSEFNGNIKVVRSLGLGTYIQAGGITQSGGIVENIWRKTLSEIKKEKIKKVLIFGLGGGTVVKLIKKWWKDSRITGVDIDLVIVQLGKKYLGLEGIDIRIQDAYNFPSQGYDLVIVDLYKGREFPQKFEDEKFLRKLTKNKIVIFNRLYYGEKRPEAMKFMKKLEKIFPEVTPVYPQANVMFVCSGRIGSQ